MNEKSIKMFLSVIIPTWNRRELLKEAIVSVLQQQVPCEVIVCDDGSTEDMGRLCDEFSLVWSRTDDRRGAQAARNRGLAQAKGEVVLFLDSDDVLADEGVALLLNKFIEDPTLDYVWGKVTKTDETLSPLPTANLVGENFDNIPVAAAGYHWHTMGVIYKTHYLRERVGSWNEALTGSQDWEYQARVKLAGGKGRFVDALVGYWRQHEGSRVGTSAYRPDYVKSVRLACESIRNHAQEMERYNYALGRRLSRRLLRHALEAGAHSDPLERERCIRSALKIVCGEQLGDWIGGGWSKLPVTIDKFLWKHLSVPI
jgi:glycosyltransferase involved in cell wall biosynthesis